VTDLQPVSFRKGRAHLPRLSAPYVPGRRHERFWTAAEIAVVREHYPQSGAEACLAHLPAHRSKTTVYQQAHKLGLRSEKPGGGPKQRLVIPIDVEEQIRTAWPLMDGKKRGEVNALADRLKVPRWWLSKRLVRLGLAMPHKKEPPWTSAEDELLQRVPLYDLKRATKIFREHGFSRTPVSIKVRSTRLKISLRAANPFLSALQAATIVGFDPKNLGTMILAGAIRAERRDDRRLPQQGGSRWMIERHELRRFVLDNLERIDLRKVDKFAFVDLLVRGPTETAARNKETENCHAGRAPAARAGGGNAPASPAPVPDEFKSLPVGVSSRPAVRAGDAAPEDSRPSDGLVASPARSAVSGAARRRGRSRLPAGPVDPDQRAIANLERFAAELRRLARARGRL
jgi:hypothetical protein